MYRELKEEEVVRTDCRQCGHHFLDGDMLDRCGKNVPNGVAFRITKDGMTLGCNEWYERLILVPLE